MIRELADDLGLTIEELELAFYRAARASGRRDDQVLCGHCGYHADELGGASLAWAYGPVVKINRQLHRTGFFASGEW